MRLLRLILTAVAQPWPPTSGPISAMSMFGVVLAVDIDWPDVPPPADLTKRPLTIAERRAWKALTAQLRADHPEQFGPPTLPG